MTATVYVARGLRHSLLSCRESEHLVLVKKLFDTHKPTQPLTASDATSVPSSAGDSPEPAVTLQSPQELPQAATDLPPP